jgi:hypothetical protein
MRGVVDLFEEGGVDIVFGGCAHVYERPHPLWFTPDPVPTTLKHPFTIVNGVFEIDTSFVGNGGGPPDGILYVVTGDGGPMLDPGMTIQPFTNTATFHPGVGPKSFTVLDVDGFTVQVRQVSGDGAVIDSFSFTKP